MIVVEKISEAGRRIVDSHEHRITHLLFKVRKTQGVYASLNGVTVSDDALRITLIVSTPSLPVLHRTLSLLCRRIRK